jgi:hypothetical protein
VPAEPSEIPIRTFTSPSHHGLRAGSTRAFGVADWQKALS